MGGKTIWTRLAEAVADLPEPFTRRNVLAWFAEHYPEVNGNSVSTHLHYATSNVSPKSKGPTFASRTPLVTRIARGEYVVFRPDGHRASLEMTPSTADGLTRRFRSSEPPVQDAPTPEHVHVALVGCGRRKRGAPSPAAELYTGHPYRLARRMAELVSEDWFILSAEHGLLAPDDWVAPYDLALNDTSPPYRDAWGKWCVARLRRKVGSLDGRSVIVLASRTYADAVCEPLRREGAILTEPLDGLNQGKRISWLRQRVGSLPEIVHVSQPENTRETIGNSERDAAIAETLIEYGAQNTRLHESRLGFAHTAAADQLLEEDPFAFLLGVVFDEGIQAERAWQAPYELKQRLGHLDPYRLRNELATVRSAVAAPPALHRYTSIIPEAVVRAAARVCDEYNGDAALIWSDGSTTAQVDSRLRGFHRIGQKKAPMAVELLMTHMGVELGEHTGTNVAYDIHVRRVFLRTGLVDVDSFESVKAMARRLHPERPGLLDLPTWLVGRGWCHPSKPNCDECPLAGPCRQLIARSPSSNASSTN